MYSISNPTNFPHDSQHILNKDLVNAKLEALEHLKTLSNLFEEKVEKSFLQPVRKEKLNAENQKILKEIENLENMVKVWNENLKPKSPKRDIFKEIGNRLKKISPTNKASKNLQSKSVKEIGFKQEYENYQKIYSNLFLQLETNFKYLNRREQLQLLIDDINKELPILESAIEQLKKINFSEIMHDASIASLFSNNEHLFEAFKAQIGAYHNELKSDSNNFEKENFSSKKPEIREKSIERAKDYLNRWHQQKPKFERLMESLKRKLDVIPEEADKVQRESTSPRRKRNS